jgi:hypothetical protein
MSLNSVWGLQDCSRALSFASTAANAEDGVSVKLFLGTRVLCGFWRSAEAAIYPQFHLPRANDYADQTRPLTILWPLRPFDDSAIHDRMPSVWLSFRRNDAYRCLPIFLRLQRLRRLFETQAGRLLRLLLLRLGTMPADAIRRRLWTDGRRNLGNARDLPTL